MDRLLEREEKSLVRKEESCYGREIVHVFCAVALMHANLSLCIHFYIILISHFPFHLESPSYLLCLWWSLDC